MSKEILTVGFEIQDKISTSCKLVDTDSLNDYDFSVFFIDINDEFYSDSQYLGKNSLSSSSSFNLMAAIKHWNREITDANKIGHNVFFILNDLQEVFVDTGKREYSGTGRNQKTTRVVELCNNYMMLPFEFNPVNSNGNSMKLKDKDSIFLNYWSLFETDSEFRVNITGDQIQYAITTKNGNKVVGGCVENSSNNGHLVLLPYVDFNKESFVTEDGEWSEDAEIFANKFISELIAIDKALKKNLKNRKHQTG